MAQISKNVFSKGLNRDYDPTNVSATSMVDNINGKLMFNERGTLDWVEDNGNKLSFVLNANSGADTNRYVPIGYAGNGNIKVIFSVREDLSFSEIGILGTDKNGDGTYATLFNDSLDTEKLNFKSTNQICARFVYENNETIRVYWVDGVESDSNPPRVFTFKYNPALEKNNVAAYSAVTDTVHSINSQAEFNPGLIKYVQKISGNVLTGVYQYTYRLLTADGYATSWVTPTNKMFVTSDEVNTTNWNRYEMEGSGLNSSKGNRIEIKGIDSRFDRIQVAYLYAKTNAIIDESNIFSDRAIPTGTTTMTFDHVSNIGEPVITATINTRFQGIIAAKTLDIKDSVLYYGNINENLLKITSAELETILSGLTITPKFRDMRSDTTELGPKAPPVVHSPPTFANAIAQKRLHTTSLEDYKIVNDYTSYKGTQVENIFTGYFRGETYRFAIVFYDKLGYPYFAFHLADFSFPDQHDTTYSWNRLKIDGTTTGLTTANLSEPACPTNDYNLTSLTSDPVQQFDPYHNSLYCHLRIMGIEVSGIDVTSIKDKISGFSIVRTDRDATIVNQGLLMPTVVDAADTTITRPHMVGYHKWDNGTTSSPLFYGIDKWSSNDGTKYSARPNMSVFYCPDNDFDKTTIPEVQTNDRLKFIGSCYTAASTRTTSVNNGGNSHNAPYTLFGGINDDASIPDNQSVVVSSKWYRTKNPRHDTQVGYSPKYGDKATINNQWILGLGSVVENYELNLDLKNSTKFRTDAIPNVQGFATNTDMSSFGKPNSVFYKHGNFGNIPNAIFGYNANTSSYNQNTGAGSLIINYYRSNANVYGGLNISSMQQTIFYSTGHFQPIGNPTFTEATADLYNNIEIFGGDCYLDYYSFLRLYGRNGISTGFEYHHGISFPYESTINHTLRQAASSTHPMFPDIGARSGAMSTGHPYVGGLFRLNDGTGSLLEEFNYNDVLTFSEITKFFNTQPFAFQNINQYPIRWRHTLNKYYGDPIDTWRQFELGAFEDLMGVYGAITSSSFLFNQIYSFQETGFGRLRAFDRAALESETTQSLTTGIGPALDGIDYISTSVGNQHQWSLVNTGKAFYWVDVFNGKAMRFAQDGLVYLSDLKGMHSYFEKESSFFLNKDNPVLSNGILGAWNSKDRDVFWTFNRDEYIENGTDFIITSENLNTLDDASFLQNNETYFVNYIGTYSPTQGLIMPVGDIGSNIVNNNVLQYLSVSSVSNSVSVRQRNSAGVVTFMFEAIANKNYLLFRQTKNDNWSYIEVDKSKITPFRATVVYSEYIQQFTQFHSFKPNFYICHNKFIITEQADIVPKQFYVHGQNIIQANYYGKDYKTSLTVTVSDKGEFSKLFDNVRVAINKQGVSKMDKFIFNTEQEKRFYDVQLDTRVRFLEDNFRLPIRTMTQENRMRGRWLSMTFEFDNNTKYSIKIDNLINHYRLSNRR